MSQYNVIKTFKILYRKFPYFCDVKILNMSYKKTPFSENKTVLFLWDECIKRPNSQ